MTKLVQQKPEAKDCFLACMAMACGLTYEDVADRFGEGLTKQVQERGLYGRENIATAFASLDIADEVDYQLLYCGKGMDLPPSSQFVREMLWQRKAIIQVKSKNVPNGMHMVYWDGKQLFDPSLKIVYSTWMEVEPVYLWLFREGL